VLEVLECIVARPDYSIAPSPSALFRTIGEEVDEGEPSLPTILFDEVDSVFNGKGETNEMLRGILNGGYRQGATIPRTDISGKRPRVERWPIFAR
jgi:hypothetical protein